MSPLNLNLQEICNESVKYDPTCVAAGNEGGHVAVGDNDKNVHVYKFGGNGFEEVKTLSLLGQGGNSIENVWLEFWLEKRIEISF